MPKVGISAFLASFSLIIRRRWWTVPISAAVSLWCMANIVYYRANDLFISVYSMLMATNLEGVGNAVLAYINGKALFFPAVSAVYALLLIPLRGHRRSPRAFFAVVGIVLALGVVQRYAARLLYEERHSLGLPKTIDLIPYKTDYMESGMVSFDYFFVKRQSIINLLPASAMAYAFDRQESRRLAAEAAAQRMQPGQWLPASFCIALPEADALPTPTGNLLFLLVESLESWAIDAVDDDGRPVAPNLRQWAAQGLYCPRMVSQVREGVSGDGQMIANTGLLPLPSGAACMLFGSNTYPNWAGLFPAAVTVVPTSEKMWNQNVVTYSYGYRQLRASHQMIWTDLQTVQDAAHCLDTLRTHPFAMQMLTMSTHTPFTCPEPSPLRYGRLDARLRGYLQCVHYADSCLGLLVDYMRQNGLADSTHIVITGDHTIFKSMLLDELRPDAERHGFDIGSGSNFVPLIILSPSLPPTLVDDTCYQMDIFPTLIHLLGCQAYPWHGFGANLLDPEAHARRPYTPEEAARHSEVIIKSNWFSH